MPGAVDDAAAALDRVAADVYHEEAEQALLGACLANRHALDAAIDLLTADQFYFPAHQMIFATMVDMAGAGLGVNPISLRRRMASDFLLADIGGAQYVADLSQQIVGLIDVPTYAKIIARCAAQRAILAAIRDSLGDIASPDETVAISDVTGRLTGEFEAAGLGLNRNERTRGMVPLSVAVGELEEHVSSMSKPGARERLMRTGLVDLDRSMGPMMPGHLIVVAGRPGMGKTAFARALLWNNARRGFPVGMVSQEMTRLSIAALGNAAETAIPVISMFAGTVPPPRSGDFAEANNRMRGLPIFVDDQPGATIARIRRRLQQFVARNRPLHLLVVDYVQLMSDPRHARSREINRQAEVAAITQGLKQLAGEFAIPIVGLSQLSRKVEERAEKRPIMSDLRESGQIEQDADIIILLYRAAYYHGLAEPEETDPGYPAWREKMDRIKRDAEAIIGKGRFAQGETVHLDFDGPRVLYGNRFHQPGDHE